MQLKEKKKFPLDENEGGEKKKIINKSASLIIQNDFSTRSFEKEIRWCRDAQMQRKQQLPSKLKETRAVFSFGVGVTDKKHVGEFLTTEYTKGESRKKSRDLVGGRF